MDIDASPVNKTGYDSWLKNMFRVGFVSSQNTDDIQAAVRVVYPDRQNLVSEPLPILQKSTKGTKDYWSPEVGEQVLTLHLPNGIHKGFLLGAFQSTRDRPPVTDPNKRHTTFADGSVFEFDKGSSVLFINTKGPITLITEGPVFIESTGELTLKSAAKVNIEAPEISLDAPTVKIKGNIEHEGDMNTSGRHRDSAGNHS
jgi:phage baseplate assembly protein V